VSDIAQATYVIDLQHNLNKRRIPSATPNDPLAVLVYQEGLPTVDHITAVGVLSADRKTFRVTVPTQYGEESHSWSYGLLCDSLES
jgi:hypothetical protein